MKKGKLIGRGLTAEVYEWGKDKVVKLYFKRVKDQWIKEEFEIGRTIHDAGVPSPEIFDMIEVDGRKGIVFERIYGKTMLKHVEAEPWRINYYAQQMADLQYRIHKCSESSLPSQKERLEEKIKRSANILGDKTNLILRYLETLPDGVQVCHGDLHFDNIIVSQNSMVAIDWTGGYRGNPVGDVARTWLNINSPHMPLGTSEFFFLPYMMGKQVTHSAYVNEYMAIAKVRYEDIDAWILPLAAARLEEGISGEKLWLFDTINKRLKHIKV